MFRPYREESRKNWGADGESLTLEQVNCGARLRIADALETLARDREDLERNLGYWKRRALAAEGDCTALRRRITALKGVITRMKNRGA